MPVTKSAKKKLRKDKNRELANKNLKNLLQKSIKAAKKDQTSKNIQKAIGLADKAAKRHIIHKNKSARIKSRLAKTNVPVQEFPKEFILRA